MAALCLCRFARRGWLWKGALAAHRDFWSRSRKEKEPVVAEAVEEVKTEPVLVCPPLRSRVYTPPDDLQNRLESCLKEVLGSSLPSNWQDISLDDGHVKFRLLAHLADDLGHAVPNSRLHQVCRVGDVLDFYSVPSVQDRSKFDELVAGFGEDIPEELFEVATANMVKLTATPLSALVDEPVHIQITGLAPFQVVCLQASLKDEKGNLFGSKAYYKASETGEVDLERDPSLGGDYMGVHPMGLFWSLKPERFLSRLAKKDVNIPYQVHIELSEPHFPIKGIVVSPPMDSLTLERWYVAPGVTRILVKEGRLRGALFLPPGKGPFPGVIDLFGGTGGLIEFRASLLASHGFAALALAYWGYDDLPSHLEKVDLEYFEEGAEFLLRHPKVLGPGVGVVSVCKGAEIGLSLAINLKQIKATVLINGPNFVTTDPHVYRGQVNHPVPCNIELSITNAFGLAEFYRTYEETADKDSKYCFPIEKAQGHFLFVVGEDDKNLNSKAHAHQATAQLMKSGKKNWTLLSYPGAGHLIEPPYAPLCSASRIPFVIPSICWGGEVVQHAAAQEHSWKEIQKFLREHLLPDASSQL